MPPQPDRQPALEHDQARLRLCEALAVFADQRNWFRATHAPNGMVVVQVWAWDDDVDREPWAIAEKALNGQVGLPNETIRLRRALEHIAADSKERWARQRALDALGAASPDEATR